MVNDGVCKESMRSVYFDIVKGDYKWFYLAYGTEAIQPRHYVY